jgi:hypothetical protein
MGAHCPQLGLQQYSPPVQNPLPQGMPELAPSGLPIPASTQLRAPLVQSAVQPQTPLEQTHKDGTH